MSQGFFYLKNLKKTNKMSKVNIVADKNGHLISVSQNNPEYGAIRVEQTFTSFNDRGWLRNSKRSAFIRGKVEDLQGCNYRTGQEIKGTIVVIESLTPFNAENPDQNLKIAGDSGIICRVDDQPIYRQSFFTSNLNAMDELIMHTNSEEIREVQAVSKTLSTLGKKREAVTL